MGIEGAPRFLIVKTSSMGDVVHALPLVSDIAAHVPGATIDWVVEEGFAAIPALHPAVSRVVPVAMRRWRRRLWSAATWRELGAARRALQEHTYHRIVDCQGLVKSAWIASWATGPIAGPDASSAREPFAARFYDLKFAIDRGAHAIARNRRLAAAALGYACDGAPRFGLRLADPPPPEAAALTTEPLAVLLTNASRATKLWPDDRWAEVAAALAQQGLRAVLFWGSADEQTRTRARAARMPRAVVAPRLSLAQIAAVMAQARVVVGLDTGLSHLAAAVGAPTVGIYCDYDPSLVGITGESPALTASLGGVDRAPAARDVVDAASRVMAARAEPRG
jgi:heptosyltransferase-1